MRKIVQYLIILLLVIITILLNLDLFKKEEVEAINYYDCSKSSIVLETSNNSILYANNIHERMLPASTTKILTCITAIEYLNLEELVFILPEMVQTEGSSIYLEVGDVICVKDLLYGLMLNSGNDAANAIAYHYNNNINDFVYLMNKVAKKIGMKDSTFENPSGLDTSSKNYTTTYDMALLMSYAMKNETFRKITMTKNYSPTIYTGKIMYFHNKHKLIQNDIAIGGKTGYTTLAKRTLVSCFEKNNKQIVVVTFNCSDDWQTHKSLAEYGFTKIK